MKLTIGGRIFCLGVNGQLTLVNCSGVMVVIQKGTLAYRNGNPRVVKHFSEGDKIWCEDGNAGFLSLEGSVFSVSGSYQIR